MDRATIIREMDARGYDFDPDDAARPFVPREGGGLPLSWRAAEEKVLGPRPIDTSDELRG